MLPMKITMAAVGSLLILIGMYCFPFGQDMFMLWLTQQVGGQAQAWTALYFICFSLIFVGFMMGGLKMLPIQQMSRIFQLMVTNPVGFVILVVVMFIISQIAFRFIGGA